MFLNIRDKNGKLKCRYNPETRQREFREHGQVEVIDLRIYERAVSVSIKGVRKAMKRERLNEL